MLRALGVAIAALLLLAPVAGAVRRAPCAEEAKRAASLTVDPGGSPADDLGTACDTRGGGRC